MPKRLRAHSNPLGHALFDTPTAPAEVDWHALYPAYFAPKSATAAAAAGNEKSNGDGDVKMGSTAVAASAKPAGTHRVTFADVGCGFGGLLVALSTAFPNELSLGLEIRDAVVDMDLERIKKLRAEHANDARPAGAVAGAYENISVVRTNIMKYAPNFFHKGQLTKMFILFADPHFKKSNHRRRVINPNFLAMYAYCLAPGGLLYTITDVKELADWMILHCTEHPLFERLTDAEMATDICVTLIAESTEEGQKVTRLKGQKYPAVFRRINDGQAKSKNHFAAVAAAAAAAAAPATATAATDSSSAAAAASKK